IQFLKNSPVFELLKEAASLLQKAGEKNVSVELHGEDGSGPVELCLKWDWSSSSGKSPIYGGVYDSWSTASWYEVNVTLATDKQGNVRGYVFNRGTENTIKVL